MVMVAYWCPACYERHGEDAISWTIADQGSAPFCARTGQALEVQVLQTEPDQPAFARSCSSCSAELSERARFCPRCGAPAPPHAPPAPAEPWRAGADKHVSLYPRPEVWHCIFCGQRNHHSSDLVCARCERLRPFAGGSVTMMQCGVCSQWTLAMAHFCEWCGYSFTQGLEPEEPPVTDLVAEMTKFERVFADYGFPAYPGVAYLCERSETLPDGTSRCWHAFSSNDDPAIIAAYFYRFLGADGFVPRQPGGLWRRRSANITWLLEVLPIDAPGLHEQCTVQPPQKARSVLFLVERVVEQP